jgi:hypothetical protein
MKFYRQFDPSVDQFIYERYFKDKNSPGFFIECGAFDGETAIGLNVFKTLAINTSRPFVFATAGIGML